MSDPPGTGLVQDEEDVALWAALKGDSSGAVRERLFARYAAFARNIARRQHRERSYGDIELADLHQLAYAGLLEALDRFDPDRGTPFRPFAAHRISGSIRDGIMRMNEVREQISWRQRRRRERLRSLSEDGAEQGSASDLEKLAEIAAGLALGFMLEGTGLFTREEEDNNASVTTAYDSLAWKETVTQLNAELSALPEREQTILRQHYLNGMDFEQISSLLGLSIGRISQLHRAALSRIRKRMAWRGHFKLEK